MFVRRFANVWIMLLVAAGLLLAPLATPVMAGSMAGMSGSEMQAPAMADDMPCCPDQTKSKGCDACPYLALCMFTISLPGPSGAASLIAPRSLRGVLAIHDDLLLDGLGAQPPDHPPRSIV